MFDGKRILITGGTGSFGHTVARALLRESKAEEILILSRDEKKQYDMRLAFPDARLRFIIADVRDRNTVFRAMDGVHHVFHAAALKHVPSCEFFPEEAVKTNVIGTANVLDAAEDRGVEKVVVLSTDKAVYPINAMGISKAMMEKVMLAKARSTRSKTVFCGVRYGNVMYSRGSVIPLFVRQIREGGPLTLTQPDMTRFLLSLPEAVGLVYHALQHGRRGDIFVRKSPAATIRTLAEACVSLFKASNEVKVIGIREGEKMHETLLSEEELLRAEDMGDFFRVRSEWFGDYAKYETSGIAASLPAGAYTSENTTRLDREGTKELLLRLDEIKQALAGGSAEPFA